MVSSASTSEGLKSISIVARGVRSSGSGSGLSCRHFHPGTCPPLDVFIQSSSQSPHALHLSFTISTDESSRVLGVPCTL